MQNKIIIKGAKEHNLKNISLEIPRNKMVVFTGVSGSENQAWLLIRFLLRSATLY
jgi:excinuclease UvrABC ATPase subunit